jgi:peroxiredoxin
MMKIAAVITAALLAGAPAADLKVGAPVPDVMIGKDGLSALTQEGKVVALYFWSQDCPYGPPLNHRVKEADEAFAGNEKVKIILVSSFGESEAKATAWYKDSGLKSAFVFDEGKKLAKHFVPKQVNATFVIDAKGTLVYRGGLCDDKVDGKTKIVEKVSNRNYLIEAIHAALEGKAAPVSDQKFQGCGIRG